MPKIDQDITEFETMVILFGGEANKHLAIMSDNARSRRVRLEQTLAPLWKWVHMVDSRPPEYLQQADIGQQTEIKGAGYTVKLLVKKARVAEGTAYTHVSSKLNAVDAISEAEESAYIDGYPITHVMSVNYRASRS